MMNNTVNNVIAFKYIVRDAETGEVYENTYGHKPIEILLGYGQLHPELEKEIVKIPVGEENKIHLEKPYGEYDANHLVEMPIDRIGTNVEEGMTLYARGKDGRTQQVLVKEISDDKVIIDHNHPLAGKNLIFKIKVTNRRPASLEELQHGHIHASDEGCGCGSGCGCH